MKSIIVILCLFLLSKALFSQIEIELRNNEIYQGIVYLNTTDSIGITTFYGKGMSFSKKDLKQITPLASSISLISGRNYNGYISKMNDSNVVIFPENLEIDTEVRINKTDILSLEYFRNYGRGFYEIGITGGSPGGINYVVGYHFNNIGVRTTAGYFNNGPIYGIQINLIYDFIYKKNFELGVSLGNGYFNDKEREFIYAGPFCHLKIFGLYAEVGVGFGYGWWSSPQRIFQIGYIYSFR